MGESWCIHAYKLEWHVHLISIRSIVQARIQTLRMPCWLCGFACYRREHEPETQQQANPLPVMPLVQV